MVATKRYQERDDIANFQGVYTSMEELVALRCANLQLDLTGRKKALATMAGAHSSAFRGRGIDFDEVRIYQPGDDVRNIDWRVTARSGRPHTKLFREERERPVYLVVDQRSTMFFGTRTAFKSVAAAKVAGLLAWAAKDQGDRIGGFVFGDDDVQEVRPRDGKRGIQNFFRLLLQFNQQLASQPAQPNSTAQSSFNQALLGLCQVVRPGSLVILISDLLNFNDSAVQALERLRQHNDMIAIRVTDPIEKQLPPAGIYGFTNGSQTLKLNTKDKSLRKHYSLQYLQQRQQLRDRLLRLTIPLLEISTDDDYSQRLLQDLGGRL